MQALATLVADPRLERFVLAVIILNAITLGLETSETAMAAAGPLILAIDRICLSIFVVELALRLVVHRARFFRDPWSVFDLAVVAVALMPSTGPFSILRALRVLRVLRLVSAVPSMRRVVGGLITALPGMGSIMLLLVIVYYVFSVMATKLFGDRFPEWFGTIGGSAYTLFQVMTLESWSMGIVRPVMEVYPYAWAFFLPYILCTTFTVLNLFIGIVVNAMQSEHAKEEEEARAAAHEDADALLREVRALREEVRALGRGLEKAG